MPRRRVNVNANANANAQGMRITGANPAPAPAPANPALVNRGLPLEHLLALVGKEFTGVKGVDSTVAEYKFESVQRILELMSCTDEEKLGCIVLLLDVEAHRWWNTMKRGTTYIEACKRKFLELVLGSLTVVEYESEFALLSQYALEIVLTERDRCMRFHFWLNREIQVYLVAQNTELFDEMVEKAKYVEETLVELSCSIVTESRKMGRDTQGYDRSA
ncbi:uncharacterized protein LOC105795749 [Gossypium raimondii]|uniref:uncharacterized protein LOC105795749 n=1 Tax=Gossypium raimondii TaxID=29730 RepID=UPI00063AB9B5|nr:uncharacterized protein LOC105795749 [Gossypium raimondii]